MLRTAVCLLNVALLPFFWYFYSYYSYHIGVIMLKFIFILFFMWGLQCFAQNGTTFPQLQFKLFEKNDQLPHSAVFSIAEDDDNLLWVGTVDGLTRNDGYRLKNFFRNPKNKEGLGDNTVTGLVCFNHKIYTSSNEGTSYYDCKFKKFHQLDTTLKTNINKEFRVCFLNQGKRLIAFGGQQNYSIDENNKVSSLPITYKNEALKNKLGVYVQILTATVDAHNNIWINSLKRIMQINPTSLEIEQVIDNKELGVQEINSVLAVGNNLWICSNEGILYCYNTVSKKKTTIKSTIIWHKSLTKYRYNNEDWLLVVGAMGYTVINANTNAFIDIKFESEINEVYIDKQNAIWLGTDKGLYYSEKKNTLITNVPINEGLLKTIENKEVGIVKYFISTKDHYYQLLNTGDGAAQYDKNWKFIKAYKSNYNDTTRIAMGGINGIYEYNNYYWVTTWYKGLAKCTKDFKVLKWFDRNILDVNDNTKDTRSIIPISDNNYLVAGYFSLGIFNIKEEVYKKVYTNSANSQNVLPKGIITSVVVVGKECYFGTERLGMYTINLITNKIENVPLQYNNLQITKIILVDSLLWISTSNGLVQYNIKSRKSNTFLRENGLVSDKIYRMDYSKQNNTLWMCSYGGVIAFNTKTYKVNNYNNKVGLNNTVDAVIIDDSGNAVVSNDNYIATFKSQVLEANIEQKKSVITELLVNNENVDWVYDDTTKYIKLSYRKNNIAFHFTLATASGNEEYYYKLNNKWYTSYTGFVQFNNLAPGTYKIYVSNQPIDAVNNDFILITINPPFYNTWWFYGLSILTIGSIFYAFYKVKSNNIRKQIILQKTYEQKLADSEMQTLRSQMNPHFMFNTLNSINSYIIQNKTALASEYLTTFSKLMRSILDLSKQETVPLSKDIGALKMYMELEALRLENKFDYSIVVDQNIDKNSVKIPSLIMQPFVENAIWHGLHNKEAKGNIMIQIKETGEGNLIITIEDDGIGRKAAGALKKEHTNHKSYGIDITTNRLQLLSKSNTVTFTDLYDEKNKSIGTKVTLFLKDLTNNFD